MTAAHDVLAASVAGITLVVGSDGTVALGSKDGTTSVDWRNIARSISSTYSSSAEVETSNG